jgi:formylglycine-generating enzyme required for sulfatase activity
MVVIASDAEFAQGPTLEEHMVLKNAGVHTIGRRKAVAVPSFAVARTEVTLGQFKAFLSSTNYQPRQGVGCTAYAEHFPIVTFIPNPTLSFRDPGFDQTDGSPVVCVTIADALSYAHWLSQITGHIYRLPTESEWELLARATEEDAGDMSPKSGGKQLCKYENVVDAGATRSFDTDEEWSCNDGYADGTAPVGRYLANHLGVFDILGNVSEYIGDCADDYDLPADQVRRWSPASDCSDAYVIKGGSFLAGYPSVLPPARIPSRGDHRVVALGFRVVQELEEQTAPR